ncbi:MAG: DUF1549 domain-containing protein [Planctomycetes bacterium]|nr:DUF1549 domain-containing protein [Planctomycetota bacterium]
MSFCQSRCWQTVLALLVALGGPLAARAEERPLRQIVDDEIKAAWQREKMTPVGRASDATFLRRVFLDLVGTIPTYEEARQFLADTDPKKRAKLIDRLLADPRYATHQTEVWDLVLFGRNPAGYDATRKRDGFKKWLADKFAKNEPYDRLARELLLAEQEGSELFYVQFSYQPEEAAVAISRIFLGTQLQCARCHDHPFESWTQRDFYGLAGFFVRLVVLDNGGMPRGTRDSGSRRFTIGEKSTGEVLFSGSAKEQKPGRKGDPVKPKFLGGAVLDEPALPKGFKEPRPGGRSMPKPLFSRKAKLAEWVVSADNPFFARAAANRVWAQLTGRGLAHPVDDLGGKEGPSHPELLKALAEQLVAHKFDLKWMLRELANSQTYQLADAGPAKDALPRWHEQASVRPLSAEELLAAIRVATGYDASRRPGEHLPGAIEAWVERYFGEPNNGLGDFQGSLSEHLFLNNSGEIRTMIQRRKGNLAEAVLTSTEPWEKRVDRLFLSVLSRPPRPEERKRFVAYLTSGPKPEARVEEAIWVLLNCSEFRFNH